MDNYKKVLALVLEFYRVVRDEWLADDEPIDLFKECQMISNLSWDMYRVIDQEDLVVCSANKLLEYSY